MTRRNRYFPKGKTLTRKEMYDKNGGSYLPHIPDKKFLPRSKYSPHQGKQEKARRLKNEKEKT